MVYVACVNGFAGRDFISHRWLGLSWQVPRKDRVLDKKRKNPTAFACVTRELSIHSLTIDSLVIESNTDIAEIVTLI